MDGLADNWRCLYLGSPDAVRMVDTALVARGVDTSRESKRGALVLSSDRSHLDGGAFDPRAMIESLSDSVDVALRDGFEGLCATGDMRWELGDDESFDRLLEYEALLERVIQQKALRGVCQYRRDILPFRAVRDALLTHSAAYLGDALNLDNLFYMPPDLHLGDAGASVVARQGEWMASQILRVMNAERARDRVVHALRESEAQQRRLAEQLAEMNRDLERRVAERTAELEVANRQLEAFSYSVAHDLRAPLRTVSGFATALAEDCGEALGPDGRKTLGRVLGGARHMGELIEGMLELARVVKVSLRRVPIDLSALAGEVVRELRAAEPARAVEVTIAPGLWAVGDPTLVRAVLTNLVGNAWKYTSKRATAHVAIGQRGEESGKPVFYVRDDGAGFDMQYAQKLFGVFQRMHRADEFPGHGVGLATVERIVSRHGGRVWAEARPGEGATFFLTLPVEVAAG
jgi:signal transduction histidine kinase